MNPHPIDNTVRPVAEQLFTIDHCRESLLKGARALYDLSTGTAERVPLDLLYESAFAHNVQAWGKLSRWQRNERLTSVPYELAAELDESNRAATCIAWFRKLSSSVSGSDVEEAIQLVLWNAMAEKYPSRKPQESTE